MRISPSCAPAGRWPGWSTPCRCCAAIALINATTIVAEIGDVRRFANPRQLMDYVGLT